MASDEGKNTYVATVVRDDFFNDPFFKNWWADFDKPMSTWDKTFNRQISGERINTLTTDAQLSVFYKNFVVYQPAS